MKSLSFTVGTGVAAAGSAVLVERAGAVDMALAGDPVAGGVDVIIGDGVAVAMTGGELGAVAGGAVVGALVPALVDAVVGLVPPPPGSTKILMMPAAPASVSPPIPMSTVRRRYRAVVGTSTVGDGTGFRLMRGVCPCSGPDRDGSVDNDPSNGRVCGLVGADGGVGSGRGGR